ncbi:MAG: HAD family hydrolase [Gammaproteobacteria bacterium AqS3]|nr:HAD family hydrolase [Gammaproteobacteria bacterium AqS3]
MKIRLVTLDLDDTLWDPYSQLISAAELMRNWFAEHHPTLTGFLDDPEAQRQVRDAVIERSPELRTRLSSLRREVLKAGLKSAGYNPDEAQAAADAGFSVFYRARSSGLALFDGARELLRALSARGALGAVSNGNADLKLMNLMPPFDFCANPECAGVGKPDPEIFRYALDQAGCSADECVHIGDHPLYDVDGARGADIEPIWYNPGADPWRGEGPPPRTVTHLNQVLDALDRLEGEQR